MQCSVLVIVLGALVAGLRDLSFDAAAYSLVMLSNVTTAVYLTFISRYGQRGGGGEGAQRALLTHTNALTQMIQFFISGIWCWWSDMHVWRVWPCCVGLALFRSAWLGSALLPASCVMLRCVVLYCVLLCRVLLCCVALSL